MGEGDVNERVLSVWMTGYRLFFASRLFNQQALPLVRMRNEERGASRDRTVFHLERGRKASR